MCSVDQKEDSFLTSSKLGFFPQQYRALDSRTRTTTSTRFSHRTTLSARKPASFWREKRDIVVILVQGFAKMLSCQNKSRTR